MESWAQLEGAKLWLIVLCPYVAGSEKLAALKVAINLSVNGSFKIQKLRQLGGATAMQGSVCAKTVASSSSYLLWNASTGGT